MKISIPVTFVYSEGNFKKVLLLVSQSSRKSADQSREEVKQQSNRVTHEYGK